MRPSTPPTRRPATRRDRLQSQPALDLLEECVAALRRCGAGPWLCHAVGGVPFMLALLWFWSDMSAGAYAERHLPAAALGTALAFAWMKAWQAVFARKMLALLGGEPEPAWTPGRVARLVAQQTLVQSTLFFVLPVAALITLPFGWAVAFYQHFLIEASGEREPVRRAVARAVGQAQIAARQNHMGLLLLALCSVALLANALSLIALLPGLAKTFLGVESAFSRNPYLLLNSTILVVALGLTHLLLGPVVQTFYALRTFRAQALQTGGDLLLSLRWLRAETDALAKTGARGTPSGAATGGTKAVAVLLLVALFLTQAAAPLSAQTATASPVSLAAEPAQNQPSQTLGTTSPTQSARLDDAIRRVLAQPEYAWRSPRQPLEKTATDSLISRFFRTVGDSIQACWQPIKKGIKAAWKPVGKWIKKWLERWFEGRSQRPESPAFSGMDGMKYALYGVSAAILLAAAALVWRAWRRGRTVGDPLAAEAVASAPDLESDHVTADALPEDEWVALARRLAEAGELRLCLRALYLSGLAHLGQRELVTIAPAKSNREFRRELARRARQTPELQAAFAASVDAFEAVWYGRAEPTPQSVDAYTATLHRIRAC